MGRGRPKKYLTEEERKAARKEYFKQYYKDNKKYKKQYYQDNIEYLKKQSKQYYQDNKEHYRELNKQYYQDNKDKILECNKQYKKEYRQTPIGRACYLIDRYRQSDKKQNRGECTLTAQWIVENIFSKPCHYCGETDWTKMGCDRIDNSLSHTPDNVVPCCWECNKKRGRKDYEEFVLDMMLIQ